MTRKNSHTFYCFSPEVMIFTFVIEIALGISAIIRFGFKSLKNKLAIGLLFLLATFQLTEYFICLTVGDAYLAAKIGFIAITLMPPLGIHLAHALAEKKSKLPWLGYMAATSLIAYFLLSPHAFGIIACTGNYVIFDIQPGIDILYGFYYQGLLVVGMYFAVKFSHHAESDQVKKLLTWLAIGYAVFMFPAGAVALMNPETIHGLPSIMCGFAVLLALIIYFRLLPPSQHQRKL